MNEQREFFITMHDDYMVERNNKTSSEYKMSHEDIFEIVA